MPSGRCDHLHVVCNDPVMDASKGAESVLIVNVTSIGLLTEYDKSCVLNVGDHPFITHPSYMYYKGAIVYTAKAINDAVANGDFTEKEDMLDSTFKRVLKGFEITDEVPHKAKRFYKKHCM